MTNTDPLDFSARLGGADPETRRLAVQELGELRGPDAVSFLMTALGDADWRVRKEAAKVAPFLDDREALLDALYKSLADKENIGLRNAVVEAMIVIGPEAMPFAVKALNTLDADGRKLAVEILGGVPDPLGVDALISALGDSDPNVRCTSAEALGKAGLVGELERTRAIAALVETLPSGEIVLTLASLDALVRLDAKLPWSVFEPFSDHVLLRRYAVIAAARSREEAALLALVKATGDTSSTTAREALLALSAWLLFEPLEDVVLARARQCMQESPRARAFVRSLAGDSSEARGGHAAALVALGLIQEEEDIPTLVDALGDEDVAEHASAGLELFGAAAALPLSKLLATAPQHTRAVILSLLPRLDSKPDAALRSMLREGLNDTATEVALASLKGIAAAGEESDLGRLVPLTNSVDDRTALAAASALHVLSLRFPVAARQLLAGLDPAGDHAVAGCAIVGALHSVPDGIAADLGFIERTLSHGEARARRVAVESLALAARTGASAERGRSLVAFALADEEYDVRLAAVRALGRLGHADPLVALLQTSIDHEMLQMALRALAEADPARAFDAARPLLRSGEVALACAAVEAIGRSADARREDALFEALDHPEPEPVKLALTELARILTPRSLARVGLSLDHDSWEVRRLASEILGQNKSSAAKALLRARLDREKEQVVRDALSVALSLRPPPTTEGN